MKAIVLAFTLKGQPFEKISEGLKQVKNIINDNTVVIHGFMPLQEVKQRGFGTEVVDELEKLFPVRLNMYNTKPLREEMADIASSLEAQVFVVGEIKEGVAEEVELYKKAGLTIVRVPI